MCGIVRACNINGTHVYFIVSINEYIHNGCIIAVYRPELTEEEKKKREQNINRALDVYGRGQYESKN